MAVNGNLGLTSRYRTGRFPAFVCLITCLLVAHLVERYPTKAASSVGVGTHCRCPHESWQRLQNDAPRWVAPSPRSEPFRPTVVCDLIELSAEDKPPQMPLDQNLSNRPPPSC